MDRFKAIVTWTRAYLKRTPDDDLLLWPWIDFTDQPACTVGPRTVLIDKKSYPSPAVITPEEWTRQKLRHWSGLVTRFVTKRYDLGTFDGEYVVAFALDAVRLLEAYRARVEASQKAAPAPNPAPEKYEPETAPGLF